jgi:hypothetical protein
MRIVYEKAPKIETIAKILKEATQNNSKKRHLNEDIEIADNS